HCKEEKHYSKTVLSSQPSKTVQKDICDKWYQRLEKSSSSRRITPTLVLSSYKTPKRTQVNRSQLPTFSSPTNELDMQQEIFWDPQSPTTYKLGNYFGRHTVEISDIVNRIAPQDEKPACYEGSLLGLWIGEDAIPCTPGVTKARSRTKINTARYVGKLAI
uniref:Uncharacterized protein n=1 Tax=Naja naja TaxID=35670 RepID=A0A8C7DSJ6_NAJNA